MLIVQNPQKDTFDPKKGAFYCQGNSTVWICYKIAKLVKDSTVLQLSLGLVCNCQRIKGWGNRVQGTEFCKGGTYKIEVLSPRQKISVKTQQVWDIFRPSWNFGTTAKFTEEFL